MIERILCTLKLKISDIKGRIHFRYWLKDGLVEDTIARLSIAIGDSESDSESEEEVDTEGAEKDMCGECAQDIPDTCDVSVFILVILVTNKYKLQLNYTSHRTSLLYAHTILWYSTRYKKT